MIQSMIQHEVNDFDNWHKGFVAEASENNRKKHGINVKAVYRGHDNPNHVSIISEADSKDNYDRMMADPDFQEAMKGAGVQSQPVMHLMNEHK